MKKVQSDKCIRNYYINNHEKTIIITIMEITITINPFVKSKRHKI